MVLFGRHVFVKGFRHSAEPYLLANYFPIKLFFRP